MARTIIDNALARQCTGIEHADIIKHTDIIIENSSKSWAPLKALIASLVAKIDHPDWDTRKHQTQIGGKKSLRTYDHVHVGPYLFNLGMYPTPTEYALTRSFEKSEEFTQEYSGKIRPQVCKAAFLSLVESINTGTSNSDYCYDLLGYVLRKLKAGNAESVQKPEVPLCSSLDDVTRLCNVVSKMKRGAVIPPIIIHAMYQIIHPLLWPGSSVMVLKEHTASDTKTRTYGDIEVHLDGRCIVAVEVKHKVAITDAIVSWFEAKTMHVPIRFVTTTGSTNYTVSRCNTVSCQFTQYVTSQLQQALVKDPSVCERFIEAACNNVLQYKNLHKEVKREFMTALEAHSA